MKNCLVGAESLLADGRTDSDRHDEATSHFSPLREWAWKATTKMPLLFIYWQESTSIYLSSETCQYFECYRGIRYFIHALLF